MDSRRVSTALGARVCASSQKRSPTFMPWFIVRHKGTEGVDYARSVSEDCFAVLATYTSCCKRRMFAQRFYPIIKCSGTRVNSTGFSAAFSAEKGTVRSGIWIWIWSSSHKIYHGVSLTLGYSQCYASWFLRQLNCIRECEDKVSLWRKYQT